MYVCMNIYVGLCPIYPFLSLLSLLLPVICFHPLVLSNLLICNILFASSFLLAFSISSSSSPPAPPAPPLLHSLFFFFVFFLFFFNFILFFFFFVFSAFSSQSSSSKSSCRFPENWRSLPSTHMNEVLASCAGTLYSCTRARPSRPWPWRALLANSLQGYDHQPHLVCGSGMVGLCWRRSEQDRPVHAKIARGWFHESGRCWHRRLNQLSRTRQTDQRTMYLRIFNQWGIILDSNNLSPDQLIREDKLFRDTGTSL